MSIKKINSSNFESEVLKAKEVVVVDFYADWCGPCKMVAPILDEIAQECPDITIGKVNVDETPELAIGYGVESIPTLIVFKGGKAVNKSVGYKPKNDILAMIKG